MTATAPDVDLDALVSEPLPPCLLAPHLHGPECGRPAVAMLRLNCTGCPYADTGGICAHHLKEIRDYLSKGFLVHANGCKSRVIVRW